MKARTNQRRPDGFTLIELLVVIAIIALLVSILMPALRRAKDFANKPVCQSNLRSAGAGIILYTCDYDDWLPDKTDRHAWLVHTSRLGEILYDGDYEASPLCPADFLHNTKAAWAYTMTRGSYVYAGGGWPESEYWKFPAQNWLCFPIKTVHLFHPRRWILAGDMIGPSPEYAARAHFDTAIYSYHRGGGSYVLLDGSVKWYDIEQTDMNHVYGSWVPYFWPTEMIMIHGNDVYHAYWPFHTRGVIRSNYDDLDIVKFPWFNPPARWPR